LFGTIFILFFYPAAILFWNDRARLGKLIWTGNKPTALEAEPIIRLQKNHEDDDHEI
jgi:hypothetical protein